MSNETEEVKAEEVNSGGATTEVEKPVSGAFLSGAATDYHPVTAEYEYPASMPPVDETNVASGSSFFLQTHPDMAPPDGQMEGQGDQQTTVVLGGTLTLEDLRAAMQHFTQERDWDKYHSPRNLLLALVGEVGELSEIFQWRDEVDRGLPDFSDEEKNHVAEEIADVLLYLIRLSDVCGFDLGQAAINKLQINAQKYPPEQVRGSPVKYNVYDPSRQRRQKYDIPATRKQEEETGRKRARERFSEDQVAAMTELAEKAGWSITALTWEERVKFCQDFNVTKVRKHNRSSFSYSSDLSYFLPCLLDCLVSRVFFFYGFCRFLKFVFRTFLVHRRVCFFIFFVSFFPWLFTSSDFEYVVLVFSFRVRVLHVSSEFVFCAFSFRSRLFSRSLFVAKRDFPLFHFNFAFHSSSYFVRVRISFDFILWSTCF